MHCSFSDALLFCVFLSKALSTWSNDFCAISSVGFFGKEEEEEAVLQLSIPKSATRCANMITLGIIIVQCMWK